MRFNVPVPPSRTLGQACFMAASVGGVPCSFILSHFSITSAGPMLTPATLIRPRADPVDASAPNALHAVRETLASAYFALFVTQSFRYSPSRALGVDGLFVNDTNFNECYGRGVCVVCFLNCSHCSHCVTCCQVHTLRILQLQQRVGRHRLQHTAQAVWSARLGCSQRPEPKVRLGFRRV